MGKGTLMLRMIDIVFILLFGFIAVSQISSAKAIDPPKSKEAAEAAPDGARIVIVGVQQDGTYPIDDGSVTFRELSELREYLTVAAYEAKSADQRLGVRIRAHWQSPIEHSLAVARLCKELGIPKGLDVVKVAAD